MNPTDPFTHQVINAFSITLIHSLWQLLAVAVVWRLLLVMAGKAPPTVRYNITLVALFAIPVLFIITFIREFQAYHEIGSILRGSFTNTYSQVNPAELILRQPESYNQAIPLNLESYIPLIFQVYITVVFILSAGYLLKYSAFNSKIKSVSLPVPEEWRARLSELAINTGLNCPVPVIISPNITIPVIAGFLKPVVLLPVAIFSSLDVRQAEAILLHEFWHIKLNDHYVNLLLILFEVVFFYHPVTWLLCKKIRLEREIRVDDRVVGTTTDPMAYATALVNLETERRSGTALAVAAVNSKNQLMIRIINIMNMKKMKFNPAKKMAAFLILLTAIVTVAWLNPVFTNGEEPNNTVNSSQPDQIDKTAHTMPEGITIPHIDSPFEITVTDTISDTRSHTETGIKPDSLIPGEFMRQMEQAQEALRIEMEKFNSEEFRQQMEQAQEEARMSMEKINSEEFRQQMSNAQELLKLEMENLMLQMQEKVRNPENYPENK